MSHSPDLRTLQIGMRTRPTIHPATISFFPIHIRRSGSTDYCRRCYKADCLASRDGAQNFGPFWPIVLTWRSTVRRNAIRALTLGREIHCVQMKLNCG